MDENKQESKLITDSTPAKPAEAEKGKPDTVALIAKLQARVDELERRESERRTRAIKLWCVAAVTLVILILIATPRVSAAVRTLEQVSNTVQRYTIEMKTLDPDKLQEVIRLINGFDADAIDKAGEKLEDVDLNTILSQFGAIEAVAGDQSELKSAISIIGTAIADLSEGYK